MTLNVSDWWAPEEGGGPENEREGEGRPWPGAEGLAVSTHVYGTAGFDVTGV